ncbi:TetR/AcrR family transcriptional regulator [Rhodococcus sp. CX]|uniref:TetR/AcrR family transcriptional regulator n=1 Tax=Rhodococcus sp. CX TaxID=2789880 RepID=UPI0027DD245D|nr:TetR/AcrR family transcriptional regulator [Rhodococcus sp. CX]
MTGPGRPRLVESRRPGASGREEILDAAGELFVTRGFAATSTRAIADSVGIRQASLYHHFPTKESILAALLDSTVEPSLRYARTLAELGGDPALLLWALTAGDSWNLLTDRSNLGRLYLIPEADAPGLSAFHAKRRELHGIYRTLAAQVVADPKDPRCALPARVTESVIAIRADDPTIAAPADGPLPAPAGLVADSALRILGIEPTDTLRAAGTELVAAHRHAAPSPGDDRPE